MSEPPPPMDINAPPPPKMENLDLQKASCNFCGVELTEETGSYMINILGKVQKSCKECYFKKVENE